MTIIRLSISSSATIVANATVPMGPIFSKGVAQSAMAGDLVWRQPHQMTECGS
jgi:hypothetical protein